MLFAILGSIFWYISKDGVAKNIKIKAEVSGAVKNPGVKELSNNAIIQDLINEADGFSPEYDNVFVSEKINLAKKIKDGDKVFIPFKQVLAETSSKTGKININTATADLLDQLPGVGSTTANKIIQNRPYKDINELLSKKIVNSSTFTKIKDQIEI